MSWAAVPGMDPGIYRLFSIVRRITEVPGIAFNELRERLPQPLAKATLLKDLRILKDLGILENRRHRDGYFMGRTSFALDEMPVLLTGLKILSDNLRHPVKREVLQRLLARLERHDHLDGAWTYPTVSVGDRVIMETLHPEMRDLMDVLGEAIRQGQQIVIRQLDSPWASHTPRSDEVFPLQLIFHEVAWYLLAERAPQQFVALRVDRLSPVVSLTTLPKRGLQAQRQALATAQLRMQHAWGMGLPPNDHRLVDLRLAFDRTAARFIREGKRRHPTMTLTEGTDAGGKPDGTVIMTIRLHETSVEAFSWWVLSWGKRVRVLANEDLKRRIADHAAGILSQGDP